MEVGAKREGAEWVFRVHDTGKGLDPKQLERVFEKYHRAPDGQSEVIPGTGMGLTFCRLAVDAHGGRIWAESAPGQGTAFYFALKGA